MDPPTNHPLFGPLAEAVWDGKCVAVIGAGVSSPDYPLWSNLVNTLAEKCGVRPEDAKSDNLMALAEAARRKNEDEYYKLLDETFLKVPNPKCAFRYHMIARINFSSYITLNYDSLLMAIIDLHHNVTVSDIDSLSNEHHGSHELFYIHGRLGPNRSARDTQIVLTRSEFELAYSHKSRTHAFLQMTLLDRNVCFIGCDPAEPNMRRLLSLCEEQCEDEHGLVGPRRPRWFLLWDDMTPAPKDLDKTGLHLVLYPRGPSSYSGLDDVLSYLAKREEPMIRKPGIEASPFRTDGEPER